MANISGHFSGAKLNPSKYITILMEFNTIQSKVTSKTNVGWALQQIPLDPSSSGLDLSHTYVYVL